VARGSRRGSGAVRQVVAPDAPSCIVSEARKQFWATSLSGGVDRTLLQALRDAVARGEVGWLDVNPDSAAPVVTEGTDLILYHVGGNCYIGNDCARFPASKALEGRWSEEEREIDLNDPDVRKIVVDDMIGLVSRPTNGRRAARSSACISTTSTGSTRMRWRCCSTNICRRSTPPGRTC
jgi:hypothetical protein